MSPDVSYRILEAVSCPSEVASLLMQEVFVFHASQVTFPCGNGGVPQTYSLAKCQAVGPESSQKLQSAPALGC